MSRSDFSEVVESAGEYAEAMKAAKTLGLTLDKAYFAGSWETNDGHSFFPSGSHEIVTVGYKYFEIEADGTTYKVSPSDRGVRERGTVRLHFSKPR